MEGGREFCRSSRSSQKSPMAASRASQSRYIHCCCLCAMASVQGMKPSCGKGRAHLPKMSSGVGEAAESSSITNEMALSTADHERDCTAGMLNWPSIATADGAVPVATTSYSVHSDSLFSVGNEPYGSRALAHVTNEPLLSPYECETMIAEAELHGNVHGWGSRFTNQASDEVEVS